MTMVGTILTLTEPRESVLTRDVYTDERFMAMATEIRREVRAWRDKVLDVAFGPDAWTDATAAPATHSVPIRRKDK